MAIDQDEVDEILPLRLWGDDEPLATKAVEAAKPQAPAAQPPP
jgi:hypothetical protein